MRYYDASIADIVITQINVLHKIQAFWCQLLLQNIFSILLVTKYILVTVKQKIDAVVKNLYFKLLANNITLFILEGFFLEKIENNIKVDVLFFHSLIREASGIIKINAVNNDKNISATISSMVKSRKNCYFQHR